jgi:hypothetical protein
MRDFVRQLAQFLRFVSKHSSGISDGFVVGVAMLPTAIGRGAIKSVQWIPSSDPLHQVWVRRKQLRLRASARWPRPRTGWKVGDRDPLTPTFREWRAALEAPLKFKVFALKGSFDLSTPPVMDDLVQALTNFKSGEIYQEFEDAVGLFCLVDQAISDYLNKAVIRYAQDFVAKQPNLETEKWFLLPYRERAKEMMTALLSKAGFLGVKQNLLNLGSKAQPVQLHCVPDSFSIPESKKFAAYIFDDEIGSSNTESTGTLHIVASFGAITDLQIRRHLGNLEAALVYSAPPWGFYASVPAAGVQCVYLPRCTNSLVMESKLSGAISWLVEHRQEIINLAQRRSEILRPNSAPIHSLSLRKSRSARMGKSNR